MKKSLLLLGSVSTVCMLIIGLSSCKDDEPFVKPNLSIAQATLTVNENAGTLQVGVTLDKGAPEDITIEYDLGGTATSPADYSVTGKEGEIQIAKGETAGTATIQIVQDALYEGDETIELSLDDVSSEDVLITNNDEVVITITDDDPKLKVSMAVATVTANEDDNTLVVEVTLDNPAPQALTIDYTLTGTAIDTVFAQAQTPNPIPPQYWDYYVDATTSGELTIPQGANKGEITLKIMTDFQFEDDETIIITLAEASGGVEIAANNKTEITLQQQDGKAIALVWGVSPDNYTDVDMDLFLWIGEDAADLFFAASSASNSVSEKIEALIIPNVIETAVFGLSYTYWGGTASPMNFQARFIDFTDGVVEAQANWQVYNATYTTANLNKWDVEGAPNPAVVQTLEKSAGVVTISDPIDVPASGSRMVTVALPDGIKKLKTKSSTYFNKLK